MTAMVETMTPQASVVTPRGHGAAVLLDGIDRPLREFAPVLAVTLLNERGPDDAEILVGVRDPAANRTHADVASVPTRRVPLLIARAWIDLLRRGRPERAIRRPDLTSEVANIFSRKLGLADALELGKVRFRVVALNASQGVSVIGEGDDGTPLTENLTMFNVCVMLEQGKGCVPANTASYNPLVWAPVPKFLAMTRTYDAGLLDAGLEDAFVCAYGLCLRTSEQMLNSRARHQAGYGTG